jgi:hypothetical protein
LVFFPTLGWFSKHLVGFLDESQTKKLKQFFLFSTVNRVGEKAENQAESGEKPVLRKPSIFFGLMREKNSSWVLFV